MSEDIPAGGREYALPIVWASEAKPLLDSPYVVKNVIGPGELIVIYGAPKSGKTFLATDLALRVATGLQWFGHSVRPGMVVYIASEMGMLVQRRVYAWRTRHQPKHDSIPLAIIPKVVNLLDEVAVARLVATLEQLAAEQTKPTLLVVDTLARSMSGGDENTAQDMGRAIEVTDRIRDNFQTATVLVHHPGKDPSRGARGSNALLGAVDTAIYVEGDDKGNHRAKVEWSRSGEAGRDYPFRLPATELGLDPEGEAVTTCTVEPIAAFPSKAKVTRVDVALDSLRETVSECATKLNGSSSIPPGVKAVLLEQWRTRWCLRTGYDESDERSIAANFSKDKTKLLSTGKISISRPYVWIN